MEKENLKVSKVLLGATKIFTEALNESDYQTTTGKQLLNKYQSYAMRSSISCTMVNNFLQEAKNCLYDNGVHNVYERVAEYVSDNKYSWLLESACENIETSSSKYNYLNANACKTVRPLLEMEEADVVSYIKSGVLKPVMFVESFRNIANAVYKDMPLVETKREYTMIHPVSVVEKNDDKIYFVVEGKIYKMDEASVSEAVASEVSNDFLMIARVLDSNVVTYCNETLSYNTGNYTIEISEEGKCIKKAGDKVYEMNVDQLRESNALMLNGMSPANKAKTASILESLAKVCENFNNIAILDNVNVYSSNTDKFVVIETNDPNVCFAKSLFSSNRQPWSITSNVYEVVKTVKAKTSIDLSESFSEKIETVIENSEEEESKKILESMNNDAIQERRQKIEELTKQFKNDPVKLAVLSKIAQDLNELC